MISVVSICWHHPHNRCLYCGLSLSNEPDPVDHRPEFAKLHSFTTPDYGSAIDFAISRAPCVGRVTSLSQRPRQTLNRPGGEIGRRTGLKIPGLGRDVRVRPPSWLVKTRSWTNSDMNCTWNRCLSRPLSSLPFSSLNVPLLAGLLSRVNVGIVLSLNDTSFTIVNDHLINAISDCVWRQLITPSDWWGSANTWSRNATNLSLVVACRWWWLGCESALKLICQTSDCHAGPDIC